MSRLIYSTYLRVLLWSQVPQDRAHEAQRPALKDGYDLYRVTMDVLENRVLDVWREARQYVFLVPGTSRAHDKQQMCPHGLIR